MVQAVSMALLLVGAFATESSREWLWPQLFSVLAQASVGGLLIWARLPLARILFPLDESVEQSEYEARPILEFLVSLLGIWFLVTAVATGAQSEMSIVSGFSSQQQYGLGGDLLATLASREAWVARIPYLIRAACGIALIVWSSGAVSVWDRLRNTGRTKPSYNKALNTDVE